jgi:hypothetical protein
MINLSSNHKEFKPVRFVCLAASKDSKKAIMQLVLKQNNRLVGCDGHRLHIYSIPEGTEIYALEDGLYKILVLTKKAVMLDLTTDESAAAYPDYNRVLPDRMIGSELIQLETKTRKNKNTNDHVVHAQIIRALSSDCALDRKYWLTPWSAHPLPWA